MKNHPLHVSVYSKVPDMVSFDVIIEKSEKIINRFYDDAKIEKLPIEPFQNRRNSWVDQVFSHRKRSSSSYGFLKSYSDDPKITFTP